MDISRHHYPWAPEELKYLEENYTKLSDEEIAKHLRRKPSAIPAIRSKNNFIVRVVAGYKTPWSEEDLNYLKDRWLKYSDRKLAKKLNRTVQAIRTTRRELQLFRSNYKMSANRLEVILQRMKVLIKLCEDPNISRPKKDKYKEELLILDRK